MNTQAYTTILTPELIGHYQELCARSGEKTDFLPEVETFGNGLEILPYAYPFVIRFYKRHEENKDNASVAYLSVVDHRVQWRYTCFPTGYLRCPAVTDPAATEVLDEVFMAYYRKHRLPGSLERPVENRFRSERLEFVIDRFFSGKAVDLEEIISMEHLIAELYNATVDEFLDYFRLALDADKDRFVVECLEPEPNRLMSIRFDDRVRFVDAGMVGNLYLHLLLTLNELLWPHFEVRRYRDGNTRGGSALPILSVADWANLEAIYGREAVDGKMERITPHTAIDITTDELGYCISYNLNKLTS